SDPKHPTYHDRMADWGDQLRKAAKENAPAPLTYVPDGDCGNYLCGCAFGPGDPLRCQDCDLPIDPASIVPSGLHAPRPPAPSGGDSYIEEGVRERGYCEDFPCCGHEAGDCFGQKYGSDESIKQAVYDRMNEDDYYDDHPRDG